MPCRPESENAILVLRSGGFRHQQFGVHDWLALIGLGTLVGTAIRLLASIGLLASLVGGVGLVWIAAVAADRFCEWWFVTRHEDR
jgi:hypothetical protein